VHVLMTLLCVQISLTTVAKFKFWYHKCLKHLFDYIKYSSVKNVIWTWTIFWYFMTQLQSKFFSDSGYLWNVRWNTALWHGSVAVLCSRIFFMSMYVLCLAHCPYHYSVCLSSMYCLHPRVFAECVMFRLYDFIPAVAIAAWS